MAEAARALGLVDEAHEEHAAAAAEGLLEQRVVRVEGQVAHRHELLAWFGFGSGRVQVQVQVQVRVRVRARLGSGSGSGGRRIAMTRYSRARVLAPLLTWAAARAGARMGLLGLGLGLRLGSGWGSGWGSGSA